MSLGALSYLSSSLFYSSLGLNVSCAAVTMLPPRHGELIGICCVHRYSIVLISNQYRKPAVLVDWKKMIPLIAAAVRNSLYGLLLAWLLTFKHFMLNISAL
jgi:hypothetical protein